MGNYWQDGGPVLAFINRRILTVTMLSFLVLALIAVRFFYFQVVIGPDLARKAAAMRIRGYAFPESGRGRILDRNFEPLTGNGQARACFGITGQIRDIRASSIKIARLLHSEPWVIEERIREAARRQEPYVMLQTPVRDEKTRQELGSIPGVLVTAVERRYREDGSMIHLLGNLGPPGLGSQARVVGTAGIESRYEADLRARTSPNQVVTVVDGCGNPIPGLSPKLNQTAVSGRDVVTTIDRRVQLMTEGIVDKHLQTGAVVVLDISSRDVLAMVSRPTYNPYDPLSRLRDGDESSQMNRALAPFHPGSIFKIAVAAAAMENGLVAPGEEFFCPGYYRFSDRLSIPCWKPSGHGKVTIGQALAGSCNAAFIEIGLRLGRARLLRFCEEARLFSREIIGYSNAQGGSRLDIDYGRPALGNASLGQKGVMMTPLQVANMVATVADDGVYKRPRVVKEVREGEKIVGSFDRDRGTRVISPEVSRTLQVYLEQVTSTGTGRRAALSGIGCGGKTATSQSGQFTEAGQEILDTWFVGYFPTEQPQWVIAVLVEHGQSGGRNAAPVFKEIAEGMAAMYLR